MQASDHGKAKLPGNHGQFGQDIATESYRPLRATQKVPVRPVVPRSPGGMKPGSTGDRQGHRRTG